MAIFSFTPSAFAPAAGINMLDIAVGDAFSEPGTTFTASSITASLSGGMATLVVQGTNFTYAQSGGEVVDVTGGRITGVDLDDFQGTDLITITGLNVSARAVVDALVADNPVALARLLTAGADTIRGTNNADTLYGGAGRDVLTGKDGADRFVFRAATESGVSATTRDVITDFDTSEDRINLRAIDANTTLAGNQAFAYLDTGAFTAAVGEIRFVVGNGHVIVQADTDGVGGIDFSLRVNGTTNLDANDFIL